MGKLFRYILQCAIVLLLTHPAGAKVAVVHSRATTQVVNDATHRAPKFLGAMYEAGRYPGRHKMFIHKKLVPASPAFTAASMWVLQPAIPAFTIYYFSSLYRSHISAILNGSDPLRGPPAVVA